MNYKRIRNSILSFTVFTALTACGGNVNSSSASSSSLLPTSSEYIAATLAEAIENTKSNYEMDVETGLGYDYPFQIISDDLYYYAPGVENYIRLDEDSGYYHSFERTSLDVEETYRFGMDVHGRAGRVIDKSVLYSTNFMTLLESYADDFEKMGEDVYCCNVKDLAYDLKDYFQNRSFSYANYFEIHLGNDGRISSFQSYEKYLEGTNLVGEVSFKPFELASFEAYSLWNQAGRKINLRIIDLKIGANNGLAYRLLYEKEEVEIEGVVSGFDYDGHFILASEDATTGYVGIEVALKDSSTPLPSINDKIKVKGTIYQDQYVAKLIDASFTKTGQTDHCPVFDEERIVGTYGGGYYAAYIFSQTPLYADSIYSTYAYVSSLPTDIVEKEDTMIEVICPTHTSGKDVFHMEIVLPKSMPIEERKGIVEDIKQYGVYSTKNNIAEELSLQKFILRFDAVYSYHVKLEYGHESEISKKLTPAEKVEKALGLKDFPFPETSEFNCFSFGGSTGINIESNYGKEGNTIGIYYNVASLANTALENEINSLMAYGFSFYDEIKDAYLSRHQIYKKDDIYVDILLSDTFYEENTKGINMWIYQGGLVSMPSIEETLQEKIPYFDADDFVKPASIYSADIAYYELPNYAGNVFEEGHYLSCVTIDVNEDCFSTLRATYLNEKGYKAVRVDGKIYTYNTRGSNHYVLYKEIPGSEEKLYLDMAMYSTNDYTFSDHGLFKNRIEILIYKAKEPLQTKYEDNLNGFADYMESLNDGGGFLVSFSSSVKVENYPALANGKGYDYLYYGYYYEYNAFIYSSSIEETYQDVIKGLTEAGYTLSNTTSKGNVCYVKQTDNGYGSFVFVMKTSGYIRMIDGVGGLDF